jgi:hypothetical protein
MFCFKPQIRSDDWGEIQFADIEQLIEIEMSGLEWLERAAETLTLPIKEEVDTEALSRFIEKTVNAVTERVRISYCLLSKLTAMCRRMITYMLLQDLSVELQRSRAELFQAYW